MAKRRKKTTHHRRRRVGASKTGMQAAIMTGAGIVGGALAGGLIQKAVSSAASTLNPKIVGGGMAVAGIFIAAKFAKGNALIQGLGYGLSAKGANTLLVSTGLITGIGAMRTPGYRGTPKLQNSVGGVMRNPISGVMKNPISGFRDPSVIGALFDN